MFNKRYVNVTYDENGEADYGVNEKNIAKNILKMVGGLGIVLTGIILFDSGNSDNMQQVGYINGMCDEMQSKPKDQESK